MLSLAATLLFASAGVSAWEAQLLDGTRIRVDPATKRATAITEQGVAVPLWDGVHRLKDGSSLITHSGIVVPNVEILRESRGRSRREPTGPETVSPCVVLVRRVCGPHDECEKASACRLGRQLLEFERMDEDGEIAARSRSSRKCFDALQDEALFNPCEQARLAPSAPCSQLVEKTCGAGRQCAQSSACGLANQLVEMERRDRLSSPAPDSAVRATRQCQDALLTEALFQPCAE